MTLLKKYFVGAFVIGLLIGIAQLFWTYELTKQNVRTINKNKPMCSAISPECGICVYEIKDGKCYEPSYKQKFRGFPLSSGSYGYDSRIDTTPQIIANVFIWALGLPAIVFVGGRVKSKLRKKIVI